MSNYTIWSLFSSEVETQVTNLKQSLSLLKTQPSSTYVLEQATQSAHIIWGVTRIVEIEPATKLAELIQDCLLCATQNQHLTLIPSQIDTLLHAGELLLGISKLADGSENTLTSWMADYAGDLQATEKKLSELQLSLQQLGVIDHSVDSLTEILSVSASELFQSNESDNSIMNLFRQEIEAQIMVMNRGLLIIETNPQSISELEALMRASHSIKGAARIVGLDMIVNLAHVMEDCFVAAQKNTITLSSEHVDVLLHGADLLQNINQVSDLELNNWLSQHQIDFVTTSSEIRTFLQVKEQIGTRNPIKSEPLVITEKQQGQAVILHEKIEKTPSDERVIKVSADNLNRIMGLAGELLIESNWLQPFADSVIPLKSRLGELYRTMEQLQDVLDQNSFGLESKEYLRQARQQEQECIDFVANRLNELELYVRRMASLSDRLYREVINSHMRPFADGVQGFPRMIRDLGRKLNKQVKLEIFGESTPVDRDILKRLESPLTHILRNSVDHGIEPPEERQKLGKTEEGIVRLEAFHRGGMLAITVSDDGRGIDREQLRQKILHKNLATPEMIAQLTDAELMEFLFLPGFSTAQQVTEISGRGIGLDIAKSMTQEVGGTIRAISQLGNGMSFHFQLPLTLSVVRTLLVEISGKPYAIPLARIDQIMTVSRTEILDVENHQYLSIDTQNIGLIAAYQILELAEPTHPTQLISIAVISEQYDTYGLIVDKFLGEHDLVVRPLDPRLGKVPDISAASLLPDGSPVLIIDVSDIVRSIDYILKEGRLARINVEVVGENGDRRRKILVVDDSITVREVERKLLENQGYNVDTAVNGMEGWSALRSKHYDLVITDIDMPQMNGIELVKQIKGNPLLNSIPVIIISYRDQEEDRLQGLEVGADYYLTKSSFHDDKLINAVIDLIGK